MDLSVYGFNDNVFNFDLVGSVLEIAFFYFLCYMEWTIFSWILVTITLVLQTGLIYLYLTNRDLYKNLSQTVVTGSTTTGSTTTTPK